jgi:hypothetical protein
VNEFSRFVQPNGWDVAGRDNDNRAPAILPFDNGAAWFAMGKKRG